MTRSIAGLPMNMLLGNAAVALMAAVGLVSILPLGEGGLPALPGVLVLTVPLAAALLVTGQRAVSQARDDARFNAVLDPATGLSTAFAAQRTLDMEFAAAQRGRPLTVVLFRIDQLPRYAARHGRPVTDQLLRLTGRTLVEHKRAMHAVAHYGPVPGWYVSILSGMEVEGAAIYTKRVRKALMSLSRLPEPPTISAAIVPYDLSMAAPADLMSAAERALRWATESEGNGRIMVVGQSSQEAVAE